VEGPDDEVARSIVDKAGREVDLANASIRVRVKGDSVLSIENLDDVTVLGNEETPLFQTSFTGTTDGFKYSGVADTGATTDMDVDDESAFHKGVTFVTTKQPHLVESTRFRVYSGFPALEIDRLAVIQGNLVGEYVPFHVSPGFVPSTITRELLGEVLPRRLEPGKNTFPRINDWALLDDGQAGLMIASDSQVRATKHVPIHADGTADFGLVRGYPAYLPVNLLSGIYQYRAIVAPFSVENEAKWVELAKLYRYQPLSAWWL
jgi:hypothetical protein